MKRNWDEFVTRYSRLVYFSIKECARRRAFNLPEQDAEDIHQKVFFSIWKGDKLRQLKDQSKLPAWLSMTAVNATLDHIRSKDYLQSKRGDADNLEDTLASKSPSPAEEAASREISGIVEESLNLLEPKARLAVKLNFIQGRTHKEISQMLNIPMGTVATLINRAKDELKKRLKEKGIENI